MTAEAVMAPAPSVEPLVGTPVSSDGYKNHAVNHHHHHQENHTDCFTVLARTEKHNHLEYLKNFRVNQCPLFLQHKCTQHRPFTCFYWHFQNQRRRRPIQRPDKPFNYSPDIYCNSYDETSGTCPDGDECPYLHRVTGDTERRYHLRYYKTSACIHETDDNGHCEKNGPHCAFGHGADDLRSPIFDASCGPELGSELQEKLSLDDNKWNDAEFVLSFYKTDSCKRPPRLCRQGYACPHFHNPKDRRRNPKKFKYRSTPCPAVKKVGEDWQDPGKCEKGDNCCMCHTRTEQQFHPDIYKSTKCHDMQQTGYCPRGPFCAFAHVEQHDGDPHAHDHDRKVRERTSSDARFELARERRRQQLEARALNMRNSVSGGEIRPRTSSLTAFRSATDREHGNSNLAQNWSREDVRQQMNNRWGPQSPSSPSVKSTSPKYDSPRRLRETRWPPHPERDAENAPESELWSPDVFREIMDGPEFHEEESQQSKFAPSGPYHPQMGGDSHVSSHSALSDEISRRRTQSATYTSNFGGESVWHSRGTGTHPKDNSPRATNADWSRFGSELRSYNSSGGNSVAGANSSSPISIHLQSQSGMRGRDAGGQPAGNRSQVQPGSIGSAILSGVFNQNHSAGEPPSKGIEESMMKEMHYLRNKLYEYERCFTQAKSAAEAWKAEYEKIKQENGELIHRGQEAQRELEQLRDQRTGAATNRVILEVRNALGRGDRCPVNLQTVNHLLRTLRQDVDLLERVKELENASN